MLFFLFAITFATEMCVYKKIFDDNACTTATANAEYHSTWGYSSTCTDVETLSASDKYYVKATCTDDNDIELYAHCDTNACDSGILCDGAAEASTCAATSYHNVGKYEKYVCEPCDELDCHVDAADGMDLNPTCTPSTGAPVEGEHCIQQRFWSDRACTVVSRDTTDNLWDGTCRTDIITYSSKGKCTKDAEGRMVTATLWSLCDTNSCDNGAEDMTCPSAGQNILGKADCEDYITGEYTSYECVPCDAPVCDNSPHLQDSLKPFCGSASSLMMMFATLAAALLF